MIKIQKLYKSKFNGKHIFRAFFKFDGKLIEVISKPSKIYLDGLRSLETEIKKIVGTNFRLEARLNVK